jgi:hypothetical protein
MEAAMRGYIHTPKNMDHVVNMETNNEEVMHAALISCLVNVCLISKTMSAIRVPVHLSHLSSSSLLQTSTQSSRDEWKFSSPLPLYILGEVIRAACGCA